MNAVVTKLKAAVPVYHQSAIALFLKCGLAYEYRYIIGIVTPPKAALTVGSSVDSGVTRNLIQKVGSGQDLSESDVLDVYSTDFDIRAKETEWGDDDPGKQKDMGAELLKLHHSLIAPKIDPKTVQESFVIETNAGYSLGGTIDLTEKSGVIADTKTSKKQYGADAVSMALQPTMYDFAYEALHGKKATSFRYDVLIKPGKKKPASIQRIEGQVTLEDRKWFFSTLFNVHNAIKAGIAIPAADGAWWCSKNWCGYANMCPKFKGR